MTVLKIKERVADSKHLPACFKVKDTDLISRFVWSATVITLSKVSLAAATCICNDNKNNLTFTIGESNRTLSAVNSQVDERF